MASQVVTLKLCDRFQTFLWWNGALVRLSELPPTLAANLTRLGGLSSVTLTRKLPGAIVDTTSAANAYTARRPGDS
jgi:hypothetical protein